MEQQYGLMQAAKISRSCDGWAQGGAALGYLAGLPDVEQVVVAARRELPAGGAPLEAAHLLLVPRQPLLHVVPLPAHGMTW